MNPQRVDVAAPEALVPVGTLRAAPACIVITSTDGVVTAANHGPRGEPGDALVGQPIWDFLPAASRASARSAFERALRENHAVDVEVGETGPAGPVWWEAGQVAPVSGAGGVQALILTLTDVTGAKREEDRLKRAEALMVDAQGTAHLGTWEWDLSQPTAWWSPELYRIYGLTAETYTPSYEGYLKMVHPDDRQRVMDATDGVFHKHIPYSHDERIFRPDGSIRYLHTWAHPVLDQQGKLVRLVGVCQDVTDFRKAEAAVRTQSMARAFARRIVLDLMARGRIPESALRDIGRALAAELSFPLPNGRAYVEAFVDMGLGQLRLLSESNGRFVFTAGDLLERRDETKQPTCALTLGYLEGVVSAVAGRPARGNEMRCQSMGHAECTFVLQA